MTKLPAIKPKKLLQLLEHRGFYIKRQVGSHIILGSPTNPTIRITVPLHNKDLKPKTLLSILKQANMIKEDIVKH